MSTKRIFATWLASLAVILLVKSVPAQAETHEISYTALESRLAALESELNSQRINLASYDGVVPVSYGCTDCGSGIYDSGCASAYAGHCSNAYGRSGCPAWYASYELTFLRPYISDNEFAGGFDDDYGVGHRFVVGYDNGNGIGGRVRYWMYNHNHQNAAGANFLDIDMDAVDAEITLLQRMRNWDLLVSGGARYGRMGLAFGATDLYFEGVGPTVALEAVRGIGSGGLYLIGNFRTSMLFGENRGEPAFQAADGETAIVLENQLGMGWSRQLSGGLLNVRSVWESQYWFNNSFGDDVYGITSPVAFAGPSTSVEFRF